MGRRTVMIAASILLLGGALYCVLQSGSDDAGEETSSLPPGVTQQDL